MSYLAGYLKGRLAGLQKAAKVPEYFSYGPGDENLSEAQIENRWRNERHRMYKHWLAKGDYSDKYLAEAYKKGRTLKDYQAHKIKELRDRGKRKAEEWIHFLGKHPMQHVLGTKPQPPMRYRKRKFRKVQPYSSKYWAGVADKNK